VLVLVLRRVSSRYIASQPCHDFSGAGLWRMGSTVARQGSASIVSRALCTVSLRPDVGGRKVDWARVPKTSWEQRDASSGKKLTRRDLCPVALFHTCALSVGLPMLLCCNQR
jgi:hypothetical protein